jgi:hypothetical protein
MLSDTARAMRLTYEQKVELLAEMLARSGTGRFRALGGSGPRDDAWHLRLGHVALAKR